jgi:hypothetical protein
MVRNDSHGLRLFNREELVTPDRRRMEMMSSDSSSHRKKVNSLHPKFSDLKIKAFKSSMANEMPSNSQQDPRSPSFDSAKS